MSMRSFPLSLLGAGLVLGVMACGGGGGAASTMGQDPSAGTLDTLFGADGNGRVLTPVGAGHARITSMAIQGDGRIVAAGYASNGSNDDFAVVRYTVDGRLDDSFGTNGKVLVPIGTSDDQAFSLAIQSDGKIIVAGSEYNFGHQQFAVIRLAPGGALDPSFNGSGVVKTQIENASWATAVALQGDGRIVVGGYCMPLSAPSTRAFALARYNTDGSLDATFNSGGILTATPGNGGVDDRINAIAISGTKIIAAGYSRQGAWADFALARFNGSDGSLDRTFNQAGIEPGTLTTAWGSSESRVNAVTVAGGKIVAGGYAGIGVVTEFAMARYNDDGTLDTTFNATGKVATSFSGGDAIANGLAVSSDGRILLAGQARTGSTYDFALTRYRSDGQLDTSLNTSGKLTIATGSGDDAASSVSIQGSGRKIVLGGYSTNGTLTAFTVLRLWP